ncbi:hypothetical protein [Candidatus Villigracilis saccharophilus]|uniref:hypothetical protein n=1 Tax=Candidatus Villigracilis saccharophilus TaxID=3140684 RepID=UPI0031358BF0|nr:hypothetical protein [Anaerolineales bacterium]
MGFFIFLGGHTCSASSHALPVLRNSRPASIPTVISIPSGAIVAVFLGTQLRINVYSRPAIFYPAIGVLLAGQEIPAYGYLEDENWIQIPHPVFRGIR